MKVAVTPLGKPEAEKVTGEVDPPTRVASMDADGLVPPWTTVRLLGEGVDRRKSKDVTVVLGPNFQVSPKTLVPLNPPKSRT